MFHPKIDKIQLIINIINLKIIVLFIKTIILISVRALKYILKVIQVLIRIGI